MILVILGICILLLVGGVLMSALLDDDAWGFIGAFMGVAGCAGTLVSLFVAICLIVSVSNLKVIDEKIAMYQEENTKIEQQIDVAVKNYQDYESDIIADCAPESSITLVALYPELQADTLVQKQIDVYVTNNEKIKELKEKDIGGDVSRWWLYFGGNK